MDDNTAGFGDWLISTNRFPRKMKKELRTFGSMTRGGLLLVLSWSYRKDKYQRRVKQFILHRKYDK